MKPSSLFILVVPGCARLTTAHSTVWNILVNGVDQGVGNQQGGYIDTPPNNSPVKDTTSADMECNVANIKAARSITVSGGDTITFEWHHNDNSAGDDIIATSHLGPILVYISKNNLPGGSWSKLWQDGWDGTSNDASSWAVTKLINGKYTGKPGQHSVTLPKLAPGDYVLRPEIIALHEGYMMGGAQFYMECVHVKVTGTGTISLPQGVSFPGAYKSTDPGIYFDLYNGYSSYTIPGPAVWVPGSSSPASSSSSRASTSSSAASSPAKFSSSPSPSASSSQIKSSSPTSSSSQPATTSAAVIKATTLVTSTSSASSPSSTGCVCPGGPVAQWSQCGGTGYTGPTSCAYPYNCVVVNPYYSQCQATSPPPYCGCASGTVPRYSQCGGKQYTGATTCITPWTCTYVNDYYSQCL